MIYTHTLESLNLRSTWKCVYFYHATLQWTWKISEGPSSDKKVVEFPVSLPSDAVISRAWVSMTLGNPLTGAAYKRLNGINIPGSGVVDVEGINAETKIFSAEFTFKANGAIYQNTDTHSSSLGIGSPTLHIEYSSESEEAPLPDEDDPGDITREPDSGTQLPRLLDSNLSEVTRLYPSKVSLDLQLNPLSTATVEIPDGQTTVKVRDFLELFDPVGSVGIFRVSDVDNLYGSHGGQRLKLRHALTTLSDSLVVGVQAMSGNFREVVSSLLSAQSVPHWTLGDVELPDEYEIVYLYSYDTIYQAINNIYEKLPEGYAWEFDTLQHPWIMHLRKLVDEDFCECRMNRNVQNVTVTIDSSQLTTRIYPYGTGEGQDRINLSTLTGSLFMDSDTKDTWGIIARTFVNEEIFDSLTLQDVASRYLERRKDPMVSVNVDAMSIFSLTGEPLDKFRLGRLCRLPMADYGVILNERVVSISYIDVYGKPDKATLTLANKIRNVSDDIADLIRESSSIKLIGGTVETSETKSSASSITSTSPKVSHFDIASYGNLLAARVTYSCSPSSKCSINVDGTSIAGSADMGTTVDIFPYLKRDESGVPLLGDHYVSLRPINTGVSHWVHSTIILKTIEKK